MASYFLYLTALCYYFCLNLIRKHSKEIYSELFHLINLGLWVFVFLFKMYIINYICDSITVKANKNNKVIHQLASVIQYTEITEEDGCKTLLPKLPNNCVTAMQPSDAEKSASRLNTRESLSAW
ncbi:hypothetical protein PUN28_017989 [Cardiocondyla obscurior]|uniref:Uncharacterized protein n=1 Tax=Cardiocondyla obscurior TaxID=286306 RepID=A0AAW2EFD9_9HYME